MPTREERKEQRKAKRLRRREYRKQRRTKINEFNTAVANANISVDLDDKPAFVDVFIQFWPILKPALELVIILPRTGDKTDESLKVIIILGERISTGQGNEEDEIMFVKLMKTAWGIIKPILEFIQQWTGDKADDVLDDIIEIGDWIIEDNQ